MPVMKQEKSKENRKERGIIGCHIYKLVSELVRVPILVPSLLYDLGFMALRAKKGGHWPTVSQKIRIGLSRPESALVPGGSIRGGNEEEEEEEG